MQTRSGAVILRLARFNPFTVHGTEDFNFNFHVSYFPNNVQSLLSLSCWKKLEYFHAIIITIKKRIEELYKLDTNWNFSMRSVRGWIYTLSNRIYIGHFQYYSNVILISFRGWLDGMDIQRVWIFYFYFFQPSRLQPRCLRYPTIFHRRIRRYYNTFFFRNINETCTHTHTHTISNPWPPPTRFQKKKKEKENSNSSRRGRFDPPPQQGLPQRSKMQTAFKACSRRIPLLPLSCSRAPEQAQPGEPVSSVLPVFSTPPSPPLPRYTTTRSTFPRDKHYNLSFLARIVIYPGYRAIYKYIKYMRKIVTGYVRIIINFRVSAIEWACSEVK